MRLRRRIRKPLIPGETLLDRWHQRQSRDGYSQLVLIASEICAQLHWAWITREGCARTQERLLARSCTMPTSQIQIWTAPIVIALLLAERSSR